MVRRIVALVLALAVPVGASAGPIRESAERAGRELASAQAEPRARSRGRLWTGIALIAGGGALAALGGLEIGDDEMGPDDGEDLDNSDDGEDSDGVNSALLGGGIAAATVGGILLITGRKSGPVVSMKPGRVTVSHTVRF
jgi:hypothetical protein